METSKWNRRHNQFVMVTNIIFALMIGFIIYAVFFHEGIKTPIKQPIDCQKIN